MKLGALPLTYIGYLYHILGKMYLDMHLKWAGEKQVFQPNKYITEWLLMVQESFCAGEATIGSAKDSQA